MTKEAKPKSAAETPAPLALVPRAEVSHALSGPIEERIRAFDQIAAHLAQLQINGWNSVPRCKAACWLADGKGEHPAVFMESHYVMEIKGRLTIEPKWEYMVRKLKETVPGFRFKVLEETDDCARVEMSDGIDHHVVEYTVEDAHRQGLMGRDNAWSSGSTREMCLKQAVKRCARRIGVGRAPAWLDMEATALPDVAPGVAAERAISEAVEIPAGAEGGLVGSAPAGASATPPAEEPAGPAPLEQRAARRAVPVAREAGSSDGAVEGHPASADRPQEQAPAAASPKNPVLALAQALTKLYGKQPREVALQKASLVYNAMQKAATGVDPNRRFASAQDIGPIEAQQMLDWLEERARAKIEEGSRPGMDPPPAPETPPPAEIARERDVTDDYDDFMVTVQRAKKLFGRKFVVEAPPGEGKFAFIDQATFSQAGKSQSLWLMIDGEVVMPREDLQQLNRILSEDCDKTERGRP